MADPKYANLPGLDLDQPDVFETCDLPEADQFDAEYDEPCDSVETLHITANEAFGKFEGKSVGTENVDFSDRIRRSKRHGYVTWSGDYETAGEGEKETLVQKHQRLNCEVRDFLDEVQQAKESGAGQLAGGDAGQTLTSLAAQTSRLQDLLTTMKLEESLGSELVKRLDDPGEAAKEKLLLQIDALKKVGVEGKSGIANDGDNRAGGPVTYELLMKPETNRLKEQQHTSDLDKRLEKLEKLLAPTPDKMSSLSVETNQKSVLGAIGVLGSRLSLLEPSHLDHIEGRLAALIQKMNTVSERKGAVEDAEKQSKVSELYDLCVKTEAESVVLPEIVDRLDALQGIHQKASRFSKTVAQLDVVQQKLEANLSNNQKILLETQAKFSDNLTNIQKNFENLDQRLKALKC